MLILNSRFIPGPNVFHNKAILITEIDIGEEFRERDSSKLPGLTERLLACLPGLEEHTCSEGHPGGFVKRLRRGTYAAHIVEHLAIEMSDKAGFGANYGKTVSAGTDRLYKIVVRCRCEHAMRFLMDAAADLFLAAVEGRPFDVAGAIARAAEIYQDNKLGPSSEAIARAARRRGIPVQRLNDKSRMQLGYGRHRRIVEATICDGTSYLGVETAGDKYLTKKMLRGAGIPVPDGELVTTDEEAQLAAQEINSTVVVKPLDGNHGRGVSTGLVTEQQVSEAFQAASAISSDVVVEEELKGDDFRVLVIGGKFVAAARRRPPEVVGDGVSTIRELVAELNRDPRRGDGHTNVLTRVEFTNAVLKQLRTQALEPESVLEAGMRVRLCATANLSTGGSADDVTDEVHPANARIFERAARLVGLDICGIDVIAPTLREPLRESGGGIIELNAAPGIRMHHHPSSGQPRDVAAEIVRMLFPEGEGRIPMVAITGTNGKTTVARLIAHTLKLTGKVVGLTSTDGIWVGEDLAMTGDTSGPRSARALLSDPTVEYAVLETARGGMVRHGLGYDWSDVGVMLNIAADHIGQDGIRTLEDILKIKSLVAERVRDGGTIVLNADDALLLDRGLDPDFRGERRVAWFSGRTFRALPEAVRESEDDVYYVLDGAIWERRGPLHSKLMRTAELPFAYHGTAPFQLLNAMAALAACRGLGLPLELMQQGLRSFHPNLHNKGRANLYQVNGGCVLLDYGHNRAAFEAICTMTRQWQAQRVTAVIALPGDRSDDLLRQAATAAACGFDRIIIREDDDTRGRERGEVAAALRQGIKQSHPELETKVVLDEAESLRTAITEMQKGEMVVFFYDDREKAIRILEEHGARPAEDPEEIWRRVATGEPLAA